MTRARAPVRATVPPAFLHASADAAAGALLALAERVTSGRGQHVEVTVPRSPPLLGQDTLEVLTELLGYDDDRVGELYAAGALE